MIFDWISILIGFGVAAVIAVVTYILHLPSSGIIANVNTGVYSDAGATTPITSVAWGTGYPSSTVDKTIYVKNLGNVSSKLTITQTNFVPAGANVLGLTTDYNGSAIAPNAIVPLKLTLAVPTAIILAGLTNFAFEISITSTSA